MASPTPKDIAGQRFGRWTALERIGKVPGGSKWLCRCDCGAEKGVYLTHLTGGKSTSCGCYIREMHTKHGLCGEVIYSRFRAMQQRCLNANHKQFRDYGGRGITICSEWDTFEAFAEWAFANGFAPSLELDRVNVNGNYEPSNCRWVDHRTNMNNRRNNRMVTVAGITRTLADTARHYGISQMTLRGRLNSGLAPEIAVRPSEEIYGKATRRRAGINVGGMHNY